MQIHIGLVSLPGPDAAATRTAPRRFFIAATLPCGNDIAGFLSSRRRGLARRQRELRREGFLLQPLSRVATIQQNFLRFVAGAWCGGHEICAAKVFRRRHNSSRQRYNKISCVSLPGPGAAATKTAPRRFFIADALPGGNDTTRFLAFRCRGLAQRPRKLPRWHVPAETVTPGSQRFGSSDKRSWYPR